MKQISCRVDPKQFATIEAARGSIPRERWMRDVLLAAAAVQYAKAVDGAVEAPLVPRDPSGAPSVPAREAPEPRATIKDVDPVLKESPPMCRMCEKAGPPKHRPCPTCGYRVESTEEKLARLRGGTA